jgi:DNA ligase (NAD+)
MTTTYEQKYDAWFHSQLSRFGNYHWTDTGVDLELDNPENSPEVAIKQMISFFAGIGAEFLSEKSFETLYGLGFTTIESIINSSPDEIEKALGSKIGRKGMESIASKLNPIPLWKLLGSSPVFKNGIGRRKMKLIYEHHGKILGLSIAEIKAVGGFEEKTATQVYNGFAEAAAFLTAIAGKYTEEVAVQKGSSLTGKTFVFTGFRDKEAESIIESHGGKIGSSVSKTTTYLVTKEKNSTSSKAVKAQSIGVTVIGSAELNDLLDGLK